MTTERRSLFDVSWRTIAKVLVAAALVWSWFQLWHFVMVIVIAFYLVFNVIESYLITPKVFGYEMELSNLAVLIAVIIGAELGTDGRNPRSARRCHLSSHRAAMASRSAGTRHR